MRKKQTKPVTDPIAQKLKSAASVKTAMRLEIPADVLIKLPRIELIGNSEIMIDGVGSISEYSDTVISLSCGRLDVKLSGAELCVLSYVGNEIVIRGIVAQISFS